MRQVGPVLPLQPQGIHEFARPGHEGMENTPRPPAGGGSPFPSQRKLLAGLMMFGVAGFVAALVSTRWGAALGDDSFHYISAARSLAQGAGLRVPTPDGASQPLVHFPPLLSIALAVLVALGVDAVEAIRYLNAALFAANILLTGSAVYLITRSTAFSLLGASLALLSDVLVEVHAAAMSEALYLFLSMSALTVLAACLANRRPALLLLASVAAGLTILTRLVGLSLIPVGAVGIFLFQAEEGRRRVRDLALYLVGSLLPFVLWVGRNLVLTGGLSDRAFGWRPLGAGWLRAGLNEVLLWFAPGRIVHGREIPLLLLISAPGIVFLLGSLLRSRVGSTSTRTSVSQGLGTLLAVYSVAYLAIVILGRAFFDELVPLDRRLLSPVHQAVLILLAAGVWALWRSQLRWMRPAAVVGALAFLGFYAYRAVGSLTYLYQQGKGYASRGWHSSEGIEFVRRNPEVTVYSNAAAAIYFWTGRVTAPIDAALDPQTATDDEGCSVIIAFDSIPLELYHVTAEELAGGKVVVQVNDALLLLAPRCAQS